LNSIGILLTNRQFRYTPTENSNQVEKPANTSNCSPRPQKKIVLKFAVVFCGVTPPYFIITIEKFAFPDFQLP